MTPAPHARPHPARPLHEVDEGQDVRITTVTAGSDLNARLAAMGLLPGAALRVVRNSRHGPFIVALSHARLVLGRGMAHKIHVTDCGAGGR